ncbi:MAG TPA: LPS assembly lipoprotein LptE [Steroidobacteraceae bacterium]|jgi:LPS-assembly lipoprotein|nr:LPS assembly lipoprotein LptE [Steroidobacteraceae bacterium]
MSALLVSKRAGSMIPKLMLTALMLAGAVLVGSCGFRLQGSTPLPAALKVTFVSTTDRQSEFVQGLRRALISNGATLATKKEDATGTVRVLNDAVTKKILSVSANNIPREYEITYTVEFSVNAADKEVLASQKVAVTRDYSFDETKLLAKDNEEAILREGMARDLVNIVMRRLASL